jgi:hypothetical protein
MSMVIVIITIQSHQIQLKDINLNTVFYKN